ncbi:MAG: Na/Pi cotransporter family protein [Clostridia bacterium]|nr:Na/Pi cotransporter family protein [Clostridia bacterium]
MDIFDVLSLIGGLALFLFGMQTMGNALEKKAGGQLKSVLTKMTNNPVKGFLLGLIVTSIIQSSSATTVMVVGFVNSGIMTLHQSIGIIMGANVGTTITAWILSLMAVDGAGIMAFFKPSSFVPVLAIIGVFLLMFNKKQKSRDTATILLGFAVLMTGMSAMSDAVEGLKNVPEFTNILTLFSNPVLGVVAGAVMTAIIQSSSASVGILQAISTTGAITFGSAIPLIMGMGIGTCITAVLASIGANKNAKRATLVHLYFNVIGTPVALALFYGANALFQFDFFDNAVDEVGIAIINTVFKMFCTIFWFPLIKVLEKLATISVRDNEEKEKYEILDERLFATPAVAVSRCKDVTVTMAEISVDAIEKSLEMLSQYDAGKGEEIIKAEKKADKYEDKLGSYLVKVSALELSDADGAETTKLLHIISDFERISDHAVNILKSAEEIEEKKLVFSEKAQAELATLCGAVSEIVKLAYKSFAENDFEAASFVEPLEQVVDDLRDEIKLKHIRRLQEGRCTIELGFVLNDILTDLERVSDHCSNIAGLVIEMAHSEMDIHKYLKKIKKDPDGEYAALYESYSKQYNINI